MESGDSMLDLNKRGKEEPVVVMNFTGVYALENFYKQVSYRYLDFSSLRGTDGYLDHRAYTTIKKNLSSYQPYGLHFLDNGNYHYLSLFWCEKIKEDFILVVFDHHADCQPTAFGGLISCGSWILEAFKNPHLKKVLLIGIDPSLMSSIPSCVYDKVIVLNEDSIENIKNWKIFFDEELSLPLYLSIDKDVLTSQEEITNWDEGDMHLTTLAEICHLLTMYHEVIGADVCGESLQDQGQGVVINNRINDFLLRFFHQHLYMSFSAFPKIGKR